MTVLPAEELCQSGARLHLGQQPILGDGDVADPEGARVQAHVVPRGARGQTESRAQRAAHRGVTGFRAAGREAGQVGSGQVIIGHTLGRELRERGHVMSRQVMS